MVRWLFAELGGTFAKAGGTFGEVGGTLEWVCRMFGIMGGTFDNLGEPFGGRGWKLEWVGGVFEEPRNRITKCSTKFVDEGSKFLKKTFRFPWLFSFTDILFL